MCPCFVNCKVLPDHMVKCFPIFSLPPTSRYVSLGPSPGVPPMSFWGLPHILLSTLSLLTSSRAQPLMISLMFESRVWPSLLSEPCTCRIHTPQRCSACNVGYKRRCFALADGVSGALAGISHTCLRALTRLCLYDTRAAGYRLRKKVNRRNVV